MISARKFLCGVLVAVVALAPMVATIETAVAQEKRNLFDRLFGRKKPPEQQKKTRQDKNPKEKSKTQNKKKTKNSKNSPGKITAAAAKPALPKSATAKRILVMGDFVAAHVADGLIALYADNPDLLIIKQVEVASGLVRDDYYNWPAKIDEIVPTHHPDMMIIALGANDRQSLRVNEQMLDYDHENWETHYRTRLKNFMQQLLIYGKQAPQAKPSLAWVGLPAFQKAQLNASALTLNTYMREEAAKIGVHFIDLWRGFVDDEDGFNFSGYDVNGQFVRLRTSDGINFTAAGRLKLAFYADEAVQAFLSGAVHNGVQSAPHEGGDGTNQPATLSSMMPVRDAKNIAPQSLWHVSDGATELVLRPTLPRSPLSLAQTLARQAGRADDFFAAQ